ncbi:MAG: hypothetical protein M1826_004836 [Phylliscum demangeonii]|nr:MAG: hypothetical protein M1826_004836 [Phylliscum demangeonii]
MIRSVTIPRSLSVTVFLLVCYLVYLQLPSPRQPGPSRPLRPHGDMAIAVATMNTEEAPFNYVSLSNKLGYARKHGYDLKFDVKGPGFWHKLTMLENIVKEGKADWIWWIDFDTLITNTTIKLEDLIADALDGHPNPDGVDMILTPDCFPLNAGSMIFRAHERLLPFLQRTWKCGKSAKGLSEQDCISQLIEKNQHQEAEKAVFIKQWKMNAFPEEIPCYDDDQRHWEPGMFVVHVAGAWAYMPEHKDEAKNILMQKYAKYIGD